VWRSILPSASCRMSSPLVVLIAACGQPELLRRTLQSLADCAKPASYAGVFVVENGPRCGLDRIVGEFGPQHRFHYRYSEPPNKSRALNLALSEAGGALVVFTDDDVIVPSQTLVAYAAGAAGRDSGEFYGGPIVPDYEGPPPPAWLAKLLPRSAAGWRLSVTEKTEVTQAEFIGPNFAAFADDIRRSGGFEPQLGPGPHLISPGEDTEIQVRLLASGVRGYYLPAAAMRHRVRAAACGIEFAVLRAERNGIYWGIAQARQPRFFPRRWLKLWGQWLNDLVRIRRWRRSAEEPERVRAECLAAKWRGRWQGVRWGWYWDQHFPDRAASITAPARKSLRAAA
jgi:GT2 family glycosyltransferase